MLKPPFPPDEAERLKALHDLLVLDTEPEERFDSITAFCCSAFKVPIALVSLVDTDRQWFKSRQGLDACETGRDISFCGHAILQAEPLIVTDAATDPRFADNPLVTGEPKIRFYAGMPLQLHSGQRIGTLCLIDRRPRRLEPEEIAQLRDLAGLVVQELEAPGSTQAPGAR
ncbi:GAF domain-containing protein [Niveibacterium sp. 24ML]|uniref:GAF domain-containing protein n=1 Tax=Niveibacterium sp. 24ML TaxID=2985512 RepID=UPI0022711F1E|nr:GAF domain-containing protein [Niveibacterium sp. 24ML]MCX9158388.1 GAF domain-containing protein [Niveibacterium sp. 24ML]